MGNSGMSCRGPVSAVHIVHGLLGGAGGVYVLQTLLWCPCQFSGGLNTTTYAEVLIQMDEYGTL